MADVIVDAAQLRAASDLVVSATAPLTFDGAVTRASGFALGSDAVAGALEDVCVEQVARAEIVAEALTHAGLAPAEAADRFEALDRRLVVAY